MRVNIYIIIWILLLPFWGAANSPFDTLDFQAAKKQAAIENKMILVYFTGEWCAPCKWMNGTTFADKEVQDGMAQNFISVKSDIDTPEGFLLRNSFGVRYLPTLLIFNSQGQMIRKIEETVSPRNMLGIIESCKNLHKEGTLNQGLNMAPSQVEPLSPKSSFSNDIDPSDQHETKPFRVQVGVFTKYDGAGDLVQMLRQSIEEPIMVTTESRDDTILFRVQIGRFASLKEAEQLKHRIKTDMNLDGIVRHVM